MAGVQQMETPGSGWPAVRGALGLLWVPLAGCGMMIPPGGLEQAAPLDFVARVQAEPDAFVVDVHVPEQRHIDGTDAFIPYNKMDEHLDQLPADKSTPILLYCLTGHMVNVSARTLQAHGYTNLVNLDGGTRALRRATER